LRRSRYAWAVAAVSHPQWRPMTSCTMSMRGEDECSLTTCGQRPRGDARRCVSAQGEPPAPPAAGHSPNRSRCRGAGAGARAEARAGTDGAEEEGALGRGGLGAEREADRVHVVVDRLGHAHHLRGASGSASATRRRNRAVSRVGDAVPSTLETHHAHSRERGWYGADTTPARRPRRGARGAGRGGTVRA